jgi:predicted DNA repair protein MutK
MESNNRFFKTTKQKIEYGVRNFALLDDIAAIMDDVVVMSKIATKKNSGNIRDDLAVNEKSICFL